MITRKSSRPSEEAENLLAMGHIERQLGHLDQALEAYLMAHRLYQSLHQIRGLGHVALALGHIELQRTRLDYAAQHYREAIDYLRAAADTTEIDALKSLANVERLLGSFSQAEVHCRLALEKYRLSEDVFGRIDALTDLGRIYLDAGRLDQASQTLIEALNLARSAEYEEGQGDASLGLAEVDLRQNRVEQARLEAQAALQAYIVRGAMIWVSPMPSVCWLPSTSGMANSQTPVPSLSSRRRRGLPVPLQKNMGTPTSSIEEILYLHESRKEQVY